MTAHGPRLLHLTMVLAVLGPAPAAAQNAYPSGPEVPANLLRVSVEFTKAPPPSVAATATLTRSDGSQILGALYAQPLWSPDGRVLTLYLDPGRVKTGLVAHDEHGRALTAGQTVQLRLAGRMLRAWRIGPPQEAPLDPSVWRVALPPAGRTDPLRIELSSPIDRRAVNLIAVSDATGGRVAGVAELTPGERTWRFRPSAPWRHGHYEIRLHPDLEDPEGNRVGRAFEAEGDKDGGVVMIPFEVK